MNHVKIKRLFIRAASFVELQGGYDRLAGTDQHDAAFFAEVFQRQLGFAIKECELIGLADAEKTLHQVRRDILVLALDPSALAREANRALTAYANNLEKLLFVYIDEDNAPFVDSDSLFGDKVRDAFPSAQAELKDAGNCLAIGAETAAVFHLMRVTEFGLRAFCHHLGFTDVLERRGKDGNPNEYTAIEYSMWEKILNQLQQVTKDRIAAEPDRPKRQKAQEFYGAVLMEVWATKEAWRNHAMHSHRRYTREDAVAIMSHVRRLMGLLVVNSVREM